MVWSVTRAIGASAHSRDEAKKAFFFEYHANHPRLKR
jgi:hypothetical protein